MWLSVVRLLTALATFYGLAADLPHSVIHYIVLACVTIGTFGCRNYPWFARLEP